MISGCKFFSLISSYFLISLTWKLIFANDKYQELDDNFNEDLDIKFSLYLQSYQGIILYAVDSQYILLLELKEEHNEIIIFIKFNQYVYHVNIKDLCGCVFCSKVYMVFNVRFRRRSWINCNDRGKQFVDPFYLDSQINEYNYLNRYYNREPIKIPQPNKYPIPSKKMFIQMGSSSLYRTYNDSRFYSPSDHQLIGCLDGFYVNNKLISVETGGKYLLPSCSVDYNEKICDASFCQNHTNSYKRFDCSDPFVSLRYCQNELFNYGNERQSYSRNTTTINMMTSVILEWKLNANNESKMYSLMELTMSGNSLIQFYILTTKRVVMRMNLNGSDEFDIIFQVQIPRDENNILLIEFKENTIIKISIGFDKYVHRLEYSVKPILINVGFFQKNYNFTEFEGDINFRYDDHQFKLVEKEYLKEIDLQIRWYIFGFMLGVLMGLSVLFGSMYFLVKRKVIIINWPPCFWCPLPIRNVYYRVTTNINK